MKKHKAIGTSLSAKYLNVQEAGRIARQKVLTVDAIEASQLASVLAGVANNDPGFDPREHAAVFVDTREHRAREFATELLLASGSMSREAAAAFLNDQNSYTAIYERALVQRMLQARALRWSDSPTKVADLLKEAPPPDMMTYVAVCDWSDGLLIAANRIQVPPPGAFNVELKAGPPAA